MLKIGILDITTVGSTICQREISRLSGIDANHPEFFVHSLPFSLYKKAVLEQDWDLMAKLVKSSISTLERMGVDFIVIPSNTPHYAFKAFTEEATVPVINLITVVAEECRRIGARKIAVLGTRATMRGSLYTGELLERGMQQANISETQTSAVHEFIFSEIVPDRVTEASKGQVLKIIQSIDCDTYILGCTELPEVYSEKDFPGKNIIDTTRLVAQVAYQIATEDDIELLKSLSQKKETHRPRCRL